MHDELGAALTQIAILGEVTKSQLSDGEKARVSLSRITQSARDVAASISDLVWATNPRHETLDNLAAYLREHAARQFENTSIRAQLEFPASFLDIRLSATFRRNVLLVTKEAINNIVKHSGATVASVQLELEGSSLDLRIADNGRGFSQLSLTNRGNGLVNMRRRIVDDLGGTFDLSTKVGSGTTIQIRVTPAQTQ
jgi:signal transduction histidine kinase